MWDRHRCNSIWVVTHYDTKALVFASSSRKEALGWIRRRLSDGPYQLALYFGHDKEPNNHTIYGVLCYLDDRAGWDLDTVHATAGEALARKNAIKSSHRIARIRPYNPKDNQRSPWHRKEDQEHTLELRRKKLIGD